MYDFDFLLPFELGLNVETFAFIFNIAIPIVYFISFAFLYNKLKGFDKKQPFYNFVKSLVYFFFFYGLGAIYFVWFDFFYMDFVSPSPLDVLVGNPIDLDPMAIHLWKVGILLQNIGLVLMVNELRGKVFKGLFKTKFPLIWEAIGVIFLISWGLDFLWFNEKAYFWAEVNYLFNFIWSLSLPLTYRFIMKQSAGNLKKYSKRLYLFFISYGLSWGFRTRFAVHWGIEMFKWIDPNPMTYHLIWLIRGIIITISLIMVYFSYKKLLKTFD